MWRRQGANSVVRRVEGYSCQSMGLGLKVPSLWVVDTAVQVKGIKETYKMKVEMSIIFCLNFF